MDDLGRLTTEICDAIDDVALLALARTEEGEALAQRKLVLDAIQHHWQVRFPTIQCTRTSMRNWLATLGYDRVAADHLSLSEVCKLLQG